MFLGKHADIALGCTLALKLLVFEVEWSVGIEGCVGRVFVLDDATDELVFELGYFEEDVARGADVVLQTVFGFVFVLEFPVAGDLDEEIELGWVVVHLLRVDGPFSEGFVQ